MKSNDKERNETWQRSLDLTKAAKVGQVPDPLLEVPNVTVSNFRWISRKFSVQGEIIYLHAENVEHEKLQNGARVA